MEVRQTLGGRYKLLEELGSGGMAVVWRARDEVLGRPVAVKLLAGRYAGDPQSRARIRDEARAAATLSHPNICQVYDYGEAAETGTPYVVMELLNGPTLQQRVAAGKLPPRTIFRICGEVAAALAVAHRDGLVHRDIKMANIMVTPAGAKVVDFGIAAAVGPASPEEMLVGTPAYLAPERLTGAEIVPASDVYALGVLLYRLLADESPWSVESTTQMLRAHVYVEPAPLPELPGVPPAMSTLIGRCLAKTPASRPSASEVSTVLADAAEASAAINPDAVREESGTHVPRIPQPADGRADDLDAETGVQRPRLGAAGAGAAPAVDGDGADGRGAGGGGNRRAVNAGPGAEPGRDSAVNAGPGADLERSASAIPGRDVAANAGPGGPGTTAGRRNAGQGAASTPAARAGRNRRAAAATEVLPGMRRVPGGPGRPVGAGNDARRVRKRHVILLVVIAVVLLVAVVALALRGDSGAGTATPQAAGTASVAPTVSRPAGAPTSSGGDATHPAATGIPGSSPVEGSEPIASISPGTSPAASGSPEPSASDGVSSAPEGKRLESAGGVVFARCEAGKARLTWWEPKPGYTVESVEPGPALTVVAVFKGDTSRYRMTVTCVAGTPTPVVLPL